MHKLMIFALAAMLSGAVAMARAATIADPVPAGVAVGPQYDTTHVYVAPDQMERFAASFIAVFGGRSSKPVEVTVTPTASSTISEVVSTPAGLLSVFGFKTPIPYPFGEERVGYLVADMDAAVAAARRAGAEIVVSPFPDAIGRDAVIRWPGGVNMQLYWHTTAPSYAPLATVPENRVYVSSDAIDAFVHDFTAFSGGRVVADDAAAPSVEIGRPGDSYRRIRLESAFGKMSARHRRPSAHGPMDASSPATRSPTSPRRSPRRRRRASPCSPAPTHPTTAKRRWCNFRAAISRRFTRRSRGEPACHRRARRQDSMGRWTGQSGE
jgi:hypothetical protein